MTPTEERLYEIAGEELATKNVRRGLWTRAFSVAKGDETKTKVIYVELRVNQLREQLIVASEPEEMRRPRVDAAIQAQLDALASIPWEDTDHVPSSLFDGSINSLKNPVSVARASTLSKQIEFEIIDLIKRGILKGVRDNNEWYFELKQDA